MKKGILVWSILILCLSFVQADVEPNITFTAPPEGKYLRIGSHYTITWTHNEYFTPTDTAHLFLDTEQIGDAPATQDSFTWTVGAKMDGTIAEPGPYYLDLEAADYQYTKTVNVHLYKLTITPWVKLKIIASRPGYYYLDTNQFNLELAGLPAVEVELVRGQEVLAKLGKFGPGLPLPGLVTVMLKEPALGRSPQPNLQAGYELRILSPQGKNICQQPVQIKKVK